MSPYYYPVTTTIHFPERKWKQGAVYSRLFWFVAMVFFSLFVALLILCAIGLILKPFIGVFTSDEILYCAIASLALSGIYFYNYGRKNYRYYVIIARIPAKDLLLTPSPNVYFEQGTDEALSGYKATKVVKEKKNTSYISYEFADNTIVFEVMAPKVNSENEDAYISIQISNPHDMQELNEIKGQIERKFGIEPEIVTY